MARGRLVHVFDGTARCARDLNALADGLARVLAEASTQAGTGAAARIGRWLRRVFRRDPCAPGHGKAQLQAKAGQAASARKDCELPPRIRTVQIDCPAGATRCPALRRLRPPEPNTRYVVNDGIGSTFTTDAYGRVTQATGRITEGSLHSSLRQPYCQRRSVRDCQGWEGDDGGHLIGTRLGGRGEDINILPQLSGINRGAYNQMEAQIADWARQGKVVDMIVTPVYQAGSDNHRPIRFVVRLIVDGVPQRPDRRFRNG